MKIQAKIMSSFIMIILLAVILFLYSVFDANRNAGKMYIVEMDILPDAMSFLELEKAVIQIQQWLTDASVTRTMDGLDSGFNEAESYYKKANEILDGLIRKHKTEPEIVRQLKEFKSTLQNYYTVGREMADAYVKRGTGAGNRIMGDFDATAESLGKISNKLAGTHVTELNRTVNKMSGRLRITGIIYLVFSLGFIAMSLALGFTLSGRIVKPVKEVNARLRDISEGEGDLTIRLDSISNDEFGELAQNFNKIIDKMRTVIIDVKTVSLQLAASSEELSNTSLSFSDNTQAQASSLEEITASIEEISTSQSHISENAREQFDKLKALVNKMDELTSTIKEMGTNITLSADLTEKISARAKDGEAALDSMSRSMSKIGDSSKQMNSIIGMINDISDKINLLSLNAAIEAARAGEFGRGFAVVADEISKLADQTATSIKEIDGLIKMSNSEVDSGLLTVNSTVDLIAEIIKGVNSIYGLMNEISGHMKYQLGIYGEIIGEVNAVSERADEISTATTEEKTAMDEVIKTINSINELTQATASGSEELSGNSEELSGMANSLKDRVEYFKV